MELKDYLLALRKRWYVVAACTLLGVLGAAAVTWATPRVYESRVELFVSPRTGASGSELVQGSTYVMDRVKSYARVINSEAVLAPVIDELRLDATVAELSERVTATAVEDTVVVVVTARAGSADSAATIAQAVSDRFIAVAPTLEPQLDDDGVVQVSVIGRAMPPSGPISPQPSLNLALGLMLGVAAGVAGAVARQAMDRRVQTEEEIRAVTGAPVLGHIPRDPSTGQAPVLGTGWSSDRVEAFRRVRTNLQFLDVPRDGRSYVVTSGLAGEGKTLTALNLALRLAEAGQRVCFVEADLRRPTAAAYLRLEGAAGLSHVLIGAVERRQVTQKYAGALDVVLAGTVPPNPAELLAGNAMRDLVQELEAEYDVVVLDAPPLLPVTDAAVLATWCSGAIMVVAVGRGALTRNDLAESVQNLHSAGAQLLGVVVNKVPLPRGRRGQARYRAYDSTPGPDSPEVDAELDGVEEATDLPGSPVSRREARLASARRIPRER